MGQARVNVARAVVPSTAGVAVAFFKLILIFLFKMF